MSQTVGPHPSLSVICDHTYKELMFHTTTSFMNVAIDNMLTHYSTEICHSYNKLKLSIAVQ